MIQRYLTYEIMLASAHNGNFCSGKHLCWFRYQWNQTCSLSSSTPVTKTTKKGKKSSRHLVPDLDLRLHRCKYRGNTSDFKGNTTPDLHWAQRSAPALLPPARYVSKTREKERGKLQSQGHWAISHQCNCWWTGHRAAQLAEPSTVLKCCAWRPHHCLFSWHLYSDTPELSAPIRDKF